MNPKKVSSRLHTIIKAALVAAVLPFVVVYIIVAGPEYKIINGFAHATLPVAHAIGDLVTWPIRVGGNLVKKIHNISVLEQENEELRAKLAAAVSKNNDCDVALVENQKLSHELDVIRNSDFEMIIADIIFDNSALNHENFLINRGVRDGILPGMVVVSVDNQLVGIVIDTGAHFSRVRALTDSNSNIAVRIAGSEVYGFLRGNGIGTPTIGFFSDPKFQGSAGVKLVTSNISGILPSDVFVGTMENESDVNVLKSNRISRVMVLKFNTDQGKYK